MQDETRDTGTVVIEEERLQGSFTMIPNVLLCQRDISPGAKLTYVMLLHYAWQEGSCFPGQERLAYDMGAGERTVIRYLKELSEKGLISVHRRGLGQTNIYTLLRWSGALSESGSAKLADQRSAKNDSSRSANLASQEVPIWHPTNTQRKHTQRKSDSGSIAPVDKDAGRRTPRRTVTWKSSKPGQPQPPEHYEDYFQGEFGAELRRGSRHE